MSAERKAALADLNHSDPFQQLLALVWLKIGSPQIVLDNTTKAA